MKDKRAAIVLALFVALFAIVAVRTAWIGEDGLIDLRTVDNFISGHGLRWNPDERVEVFMDPLWVLTLASAAWMTGELYFTTLALSIVAALVAVIALGAIVAVDTTAGLLALLVVTFSVAFVEHSTSGIGTPLAYAVIAGFLIAYWRQPMRLRPMALIVGLLPLTAAMATVLILPAFAWRLRANRRAIASAIVVAILPAALWFAFAYVYYGDALPNEFHTWWNQPHPLGPTVASGLRYLLNSLENDPVTLVAIGAALICCPLAAAFDVAPLLVGLGLYLMTVVATGGDTVSGRLLAPALLVAAFALARVRYENRVWQPALAATAIFALGYSAPHPTVLSSSGFGAPAPQAACIDVCDERWRAYQRTGLLKALRAEPMPCQWRVERTIEEMEIADEHVLVTDDVGMIGFVAGARLHVIDPRGRTDPLLARLPPAESWHPGYLARRIPDGYIDVVSGRKQEDPHPQIASLERRVLLLTRAPVFSRERLRALVRPSRS